MRVPSKIMLSTLQILSEFPSILFPPPLMTKFLSFFDVVRLDIFAALGLSCERCLLASDAPVAPSRPIWPAPLVVAQGLLQHVTAPLSFLSMARLLAAAGHRGFCAAIRSAVPLQLERQWEGGMPQWGLTQAAAAAAAVAAGTQGHPMASFLTIACTIFPSLSSCVRASRPPSWTSR